MGAYSGVAKYARVKSYKITNPDTGNMVPAAMLNAIPAAIEDFTSEKGSGIAQNAIINISGESISLVFDPNTGLPVMDPFPAILDRLEDNQIFLVYAVGNSNAEQLQNHTPIRYGSSRDYLIVVGLCNSKGKRVPDQTLEGTSDALSVYAYAHHAVCAASGTTSTYFTKTGTSGATAMVSGMLSIFLKDGVSPATAKQTLMDLSRQRKPPIASPNQPNGVPRVAFPFEVACSASPPTLPADSRPVLNTPADIPIPVINSDSDLTLGDSLNNILAKVSSSRTATSAKANLIVQGISIPCQQWPSNT
jgi:hypothetical protein